MGPCRPLVGAESRSRPKLGRLPRPAGSGWRIVPPERHASFWMLTGRGVMDGPITLRLGVLVAGLDETIDLVARYLDERLLAVGAGDGTVRWTGDAPADRLRTLRLEAATRELPLTLERAPWDLRRSLGHFGAYREGVARLTHQLRGEFDPGNRFAVPLEGPPGE